MTALNRKTFQSLKKLLEQDSVHTRTSKQKPGGFLVNDERTKHQPGFVER